MYFQQIVREDLGCAAYLVGSTDAGVCAVIDPRLDETDEILELASRHGMRVTAIVETHNHADHVAGHAELADRTGAPIYVHEQAGVTYPHRPVRDGDLIPIGEVQLHVIHTPGHRPEHIAVAVADTSRSEEPWLVLTGDSLFIGDVARPDLAIDGAEGAHGLYTSLFSKLLQLPDGVEVYPGHVAGSLCGRSMNLKASSTIGFERRFNVALRTAGESEFVREMNESLPERPPNMETIVEINRGAKTLHPAQAPALSPADFEIARQNAIVLDVRPPGPFGWGHVPRALNVDLHGPQFGTRVGFAVPPDADILLVTGLPEDAGWAVTELAVVGYDRVRGVLDGGMPAWLDAGLPVQRISQETVREVHEMLAEPDTALIDVREASEFEAGHVPGAVHIPFHQIAKRIVELPPAPHLIVMCASGQRSSIAASVLQAHGISGVHNAVGGFDAWKAAGYPVEVPETQLAR